MAASDRERIADATRMVMNWIAESSEHHDLVRTTNDHGMRPILVALEDELFSTVLHRLSWTGGTYANLFVSMNDGMICAGSLMPSESALDDSPKHEFDGEFHRDVRMGEIVRASEALATGVNVRVAISGTSADIAKLRELQTA